PAATRRSGRPRPDLPRRVRQANMAPQLRPDAERPVPAAEQAAPREERTPEQLRSMMSAIQRGTRRGRAEAAEPDERT
ncbi:hypothetical protein, partial [Actinomadura hibisca]|uniref:hypothetical protein n=1 Tax=Actinomadura hibisca TaxID=68565 RepID=UPI000A792A0F